jgi:hypothetical protein
MSLDRERRLTMAGLAAGRGGSESKDRRSRPTILVVTLVVLGASLVAPAGAAAHGPVDPAASSYLARVSSVPAGLEAKPIDGDLRMWLQVDPRLTVVVLDYRGAPYLRFSPSGVQVNENSSMYYLNQTPAQLPPTNLTPSTPVRWDQVSGGHVYEWHDGRLGALAATALAPGTTYVGRWTVPIRVQGAAAVIAGSLYYAPNPSLVWFWPIVVAAACVLAALRLRRSALDLSLARSLAVVAMVAFAVAGAGQQLHGRPAITVGQLLVLAAVLAFTAWGLWRIAIRRHGWFTFFAIAAAAIWEGASLVGVLVHGFVLVALPAFLARSAVVVCLACGVGLLPIIFRMAEVPQRRAGAPPPPPEDEIDWSGEAALEWDA